MPQNVRPSPHRLVSDRPNGATSARPRAIERQRNLVGLYRTPLRASRIGPLFSAFPYPTKISPEAIAVFIAAHTKPGDRIFDGFSGSGTTGLATILCASPTDWMRSEAKRLGLRVEWGPRQAILYELGVLGAFIGKTLCAPPDPDQFHREASRLLDEAREELGWIYQAEDPDGRLGDLRYLIWSEVVRCPRCGKDSTLFEGAVDRNPAAVRSDFRCKYCRTETPLGEAERPTKSTRDELLNKRIVARIRTPAWLYGKTGTREWSRPITKSDLALLRRIERVKLPRSVPVVPVQWGDLYRSGYHQGITHLHHFYTRRNLLAFSFLWERANSSPLREALRFWLLSYNASHSTLMTRVVAKKGQRDLVVTSSQSGVLYVSGLPVEKNILSGLARKLKTIEAAFRVVSGWHDLVEVHQGSSLNTCIPSGSVDYVFTDPPFGGNIPYAEVNSINESWLGHHTDRTDEVVISRAQQKGTDDYQALLTRAFSEVSRLLKPTGMATVVFHSAESSVWNALRNAYSDAGLNAELTSVLHKTQDSFKQVTTAGSVKGDPVILLSKTALSQRAAPISPDLVLRSLLRRADNGGDSTEQTPQRLYGRFVSHYLTRNRSVPLDAEEFYRLLVEFNTNNDDAHARTA